MTPRGFARGSRTTRLLVLVRDAREAREAEAAGAVAALSLDSASLEADFGVVRRADARVAADPGEIAALDIPEGTTVLLDASPHRLFDRVSFPELFAFADRCLRHGVGLALAGGLEAPDVPRVLPLKPLFLVFEEAVRDPAGRLDIDELRDLVALVADPAEAAPGGEPDRVFVRDLIEEMELGAYASERGRRQRVRFSIEAELAPATGPRSLANIYSYDRMLDAVHALAARAPEPFVETLAEMLARELLEDVRLRAVTVRVEKLDLGPAAAGVEIRRTRKG